MYIDNVLLDILIESLVIEYNGTHAPWCNKLGNKGLWGRAAYWHVSVPGTNISHKITARVKSLNPKPETLKKLFRAELQRRIESIHERVTTDHYGQTYLWSLDPSGMRPLVQTILGKYINIHYKNTKAMQALRGA